MVTKPQRMALIWVGMLLTIGVGVLLALILYIVINECRALSFASAPGVVDSMSQGMTPYSHHGGGEFIINVSYHYTVGGRRFDGQRLTYMEIISESWTSDMARRFPTGSHPTVFYSPDAPSEAVLIREIQGEDLVLFFLLTPFLLIVFAIWYTVITSFKKTAGPARIEDSNGVGTMRIRPASWFVIRAAATGLGVSAFAAFLIFAFATGCHTTLSAAKTAWGVVFLITVIAGATAGVWRKTEVSRWVAKHVPIIRASSEKPGALPVGIGFVLFGLCAGTFTWWNAWNVFHQPHPSEAPWVSLVIPGMCTLFFLIGLVCLVDALTLSIVSRTGKAARRQTSRPQRDYRVVEKANEIKFILPRCPIPLLHIAGGYLFAAPFIVIGCYLAIGLYRPDLLGTPPSRTPGGSSIDKYVVSLVPGVALFIGSYVTLAVTMVWLGRIEVRMSSAGLEGRRVLGPIRFRSRREWKSVRQLAVRTAPGSTPEKAKGSVDRSDVDGELVALYADCRGQQPLKLATMLPRSLLLHLAKDVIRLSPRFSGRRGAIENEMAALAPQASKAIKTPLALMPPTKWSRLVASELPGGGARITLHRNVPVAIICGVMLALILVAFLAEGAGHAAWLHSILSLPPNHPAFTYIALAMMSVPCSQFLIRSSTKRVFDVDAKALSRTIDSPFGQRRNRWTRDEIAGIVVKSQTVSRGKGASYTVHSLELRRAVGRSATLVDKCNIAELEWMREWFSAMLKLPDDVSS